MNRIKTYRLLTILILFLSCNEHFIVSDADSLGLRYNVKSVDESFYLAFNSFDSIALYRKIYQHNYKFYHNCKYKSIEKIFYYNKLPSSSSNDDSIGNVIKQDTIEQCFPFAYKEPEYCYISYNYVTDSVTTLEFFDRQGKLNSYINRKYADRCLQYEEEYSCSGDLISKTRFRYNSKDRLTNKTVFYKNNYVETNYAYSVGEKFETGGEFNYHYQFNINGRISNKKTYKDLIPISETYFYYNDSGDMIERREVYEDGTVNKTLYNYTYDSKNNWILCIEYNYTGNIFVRKREITYYS